MGVPSHPSCLVSVSLHFMLAGFVPEPEDEGLCDTPEWDDVSEEAKCTLVVVVVGMPSDTVVVLVSGSIRRRCSSSAICLRASPMA